MFISKTKRMKIKITNHFNAVGLVFENITEGSIHDVIREDKNDVWVMGNGEPVKILGGERGTARGSEYRIIKEDK